MFPVISCEWGEMITVVYDFSVIIHMNSSVGELVNYFAVTQSVVSLRKWIFYSNVVVFIHLLFILFSLFQQILIEHLLSAGTLGGTKIALELVVSIFWKVETENKRLKRNMSCDEKDHVES